VVDLAWGDLITLAQRFDRVIMLDQPQKAWSHWKCMQATCKLMMHLETLGMTCDFRNNQNTQSILYWHDLLYKKNRSICIYPWINLSNDGTGLKLCSRDKSSVTTTDRLQNWQTDPDFSHIRNAMLRGQKMPEHCAVCYDYENRGMESYRQFETLDWVTQLEISSQDHLQHITHPHFYEVHTSNNCNIKCRGCQPAYSKPIERELLKFQIQPPGTFAWTPPSYDIKRIDIDRLDSSCCVYFQGGEPTIMPEVRDFMQHCIDKKRTDFFLTMCTNGVKFTDEFLDLVSHFGNVNFSFSIDGYGPVNDYWRWGSQWDRVIANAHRIQALGYSVSINTVPGIYNVTNLHQLMQFLDREFPMTAIYMQVNYLPWQSAYNHPDADLVIQSMRQCQQTGVYHSNGKSCKTSIDSLLDHYSRDPQCDMQQLQNFFDYNDQLDRARNSRLGDYIPELEAARRWIL
jgi:pyruvate-formate lyase-activating enzyme